MFFIKILYIYYERDSRSCNEVKFFLKKNSLLKIHYVYYDSVMRIVRRRGSP